MQSIMHSHAHIHVASLTLPWLYPNKKSILAFLMYFLLLSDENKIEVYIILHLR